MTWSSGFLRLAVFPSSHLIVRVSTKVIAVSGIGRIHAISVASGVEQLRLKISVCEQHAPHHALCGPCTTECRRCAELCRKMILAAA